MQIKIIFRFMEEGNSSRASSFGHIFQRECQCTARMKIQRWRKEANKALSFLLIHSFEKYLLPRQHRFLTGDMKNVHLIQEASEEFEMQLNLNEMMN
jgi:hypothetical protein